MLYLYSNTELDLYSLFLSVLLQIYDPIHNFPYVDTDLREKKSHSLILVQSNSIFSFLLTLVLHYQSFDQWQETLYFCCSLYYQVNSQLIGWNLKIKKDHKYSSHFLKFYFCIPMVKLSNLNIWISLYVYLSKLHV